ncbi:Cytochrome c family protein [Candidatus Burkholderia verschuerenii]|uniref:Cytochrome c family protein n=1 Tax=Candidatus Burkholderia verschuerenii TaxID=242163 RepID=A0A0L0MAM8_9BURK|nr:cytochrome c [Candidatus Burkholderia verschuerenii]KND58969.1 Cytochrome c family protein [Candidatus Burkholderia verschuerenii]
MTIRSALAIAALLLTGSPAIAANLSVDIGTKQTFTTEQLLARPDATTIHVPNDAAFHRTMTYRAVPLRALLDAAHLPDKSDVQITGTDGFVTHLPARLMAESKAPHAQAWLAIEPSDAPWPRDIGPFYVVWTNAAASNIKSEQWPYKVDSIRTATPPAVRWPQIAVGSDVPATSPIRRGQALFATQCMACHKMNGAGDASMGPDLNLPHNPTEYFQPWVLKQFIRDPRSIRAWPDMKMHGFDRNAMSERDIDDVIAYLTYMAKHKK